MNYYNEMNYNKKCKSISIFSNVNKKIEFKNSTEIKPNYNPITNQKMPVMTRNQFKQNVEMNKSKTKEMEQKLTTKIEKGKCTIKGMKNTKPLDEEDDIIQRHIKYLLAQFDKDKSKKEKVELLIEIYQYVIQQILKGPPEKLNGWINFICNVYSKAVELEQEYYSGNLNEIDEALSDTFMHTLFLSKKYAMEIVYSYQGTNHKELIDVTKEEMNLLTNK